MHRFKGHRLPERNRRALDEASTFTNGRLLVDFERGEHIVKLVPPCAVETSRIRPVAMQLYNPLIGYSRSLMQAVDVLRDDARDSSLRDEMRNRPMASIGFRLRHSFINRDLPSPRFAPRFFRGNELAKVDWLILGPDAAGASEVGNSGFSANARAGEDDRSLALSEHLSQFANQISFAHEELRTQ